MMLTALKYRIERSLRESRPVWEQVITRLTNAEERLTKVEESLAGVEKQLAKVETRLGKLEPGPRPTRRTPATKKVVDKLPRLL